MLRVRLLAVVTLAAAQRAPGPRREGHRLGRAARTAAARSPLGANAPLPSSANCTWTSFNQTLDHFARGATRGGGETFAQRLCVYDGFVKNKSAPSLMLFYVGNESPVEEYVNNTGLMWELAPAMDALLVWAEHRYEGASVPRLVGMPDCLAYCSVEQALADYARVIGALREGFGAYVPAVAVGGSYGGMLAAWLRFKYPSAVAGAVAASAPIWGFARDAPPLDGSAVATSRGFGAAGGLATGDACADNLLAAWPLLDAIGRTDDGRALIAEQLSLCAPLADYESVRVLIGTIQNVWFDLAEANYPFESTYITSAVGPGYYPLPAWPMRAACERGGLDADLGVTVAGDRAAVEFAVRDASGLVAVNVSWDVATPATPFTIDDVAASRVPELFAGVREAWGVWCNVTGELRCFGGASCATGAAAAAAEASAAPAPPREAAAVGADGAAASAVCSKTTVGSWGPVCCNDDLNLVNYLLQGVGRDVYWPPNVGRDELTLAALIGPDGETRPGCHAPPGLAGYPATSDPWSHWMGTLFGGYDIAAHSNVIFSNGLLDPWSAAGVYPSRAPPPPGAYDGPAVLNLTADGAMQSLILDLGAHHLDLMFMDDADPPCATFARQVEARAIQQWADAARAAHASGELS